MKKSCIYFSGIILFISFLLPLQTFASNQLDAKVIFKALEEEMNRSLSDLKLDIFKPPYFLSYQVKDHQSVKIRATFGAIVKSDTNRFRNLFVETRVGDVQSDSAATDLAYFGSANYFSLPIENDLDA
ncbi:MAG TPA: hypothetical protein QF468_10040, partial [Nitrospinota bacterium]|nr:hypothetical protein [Nitrospinota bacterium]